MKARAMNSISRIPGRLAFCSLSLFPAWGMAAGETAAVAAMPPRIVIVGDSTASEYGPERWPRTGWGQVLDRYLDPAVQVIDRAKSGRSSRSFIAEGWFDGVAAELRAGDLLLIQFGHNDEKREATERHSEPTREFPGYLQRYLDLAASRGATPVLLTPVARRQFDGAEPVESHGAYSDAVRRLARERSVALIDLDERSRDLLRALGPEASMSYYLHDDAAGLHDDTHFHRRGAEAIACLVAADLGAGRLVDPRWFVRDTDCGAPRDALARRAVQPAPSLVAGGPDRVRDMPATHGGMGSSTAFDYFSAVDGLDWVVRCRELAAGAGIGLHSHGRDEVYYVLAGQGIYTVDGVDHPVGPGAAMLTRDGSTHAIRQVGGAPLRLLIVYRR